MGTPYIYTCGYYNNTTSGKNTPHISKIDPLTGLVWQREILGTLTGSGDVVDFKVSGQYAYLVIMDIDSDWEIYLVKIVLESGLPVFVTHFDSWCRYSYHFMPRIQIGEDGNVLMLYRSGGYTYVLSKYDGMTGAQLWGYETTGIEGYVYSSGVDLIKDPDGNMVLLIGAGNYYWNTTDPFQKTMIVKMNYNGGIIASKIYYLVGDTGDGVPLSGQKVCCGADGTFYVAGEYYIGGDYWSSKRYLFVTKLSSTLSVVFTKKIPIEGHHVVKSISYKDGYIYIHSKCDEDWEEGLAVGYMIQINEVDFSTTYNALNMSKIQKSFLEDNKYVYNSSLATMPLHSANTNINSFIAKFRQSDIDYSGDIDNTSVESINNMIELEDATTIVTDYDPIELWQEYEEIVETGMLTIQSTENVTYATDNLIPSSGDYEGEFTTEDGTWDSFVTLTTKSYLESYNVVTTSDSIYTADIEWFKDDANNYFSVVVVSRFMFNGTRMWVRKIPYKSLSVNPQSMIVDSSGIYIMVGEQPFDTYGLIGSSVLRINHDGTLVWAKDITDASNNSSGVLSSGVLRFLPNGNILCFFWPVSASPLYVAEIDKTTGLQIKCNKINVSEPYSLRDYTYSSFHGCCFDSLGNAYITFQILGAATGPNTVSILMKLDSNLSPVFVKNINNPGVNWGASDIVSDGTYLYICGTSEGGTGWSTYGNSSVRFIIKLNMDGTLVSCNTYAGISGPFISINYDNGYLYLLTERSSILKVNSSDLAVVFAAECGGSRYCMDSSIRSGEYLYYSSTDYDYQTYPSETVCVFRALLDGSNIINNVLPTNIVYTHPTVTPTPVTPIISDISGVVSASHVLDMQTSVLQLLNIRSVYQVR